MSRKHRWKLDGVERQDFVSQKKRRMSEMKAFKPTKRVFCLLQGQLGNLEPAQDDVGAPAVLRPAGQRGGTAAPPTPTPTPLPFPFPVPLLNGSGSLPAGPDAELQPDARLLPLPAGQALRPVLRHRGQGAAVRTPRGHLQAVAHVAGKGGGLREDPRGALYRATTLFRGEIRAQRVHTRQSMALFVLSGHFIPFCTVGRHNVATWALYRG